MDNRLTFYTVDAEYCDYLRKFDRCVPYTMDMKAKRPFVGIVLYINNVAYYAPLSSPKEKHLKMKNTIDFMKLHGGELGIINFNNMIPIHKNSITEIDLAIYPSDTESDIKYKNMLISQKEWCNRYRNDIYKKAKKLYSVVKDGKASESLKNRCCQFAVDEEKYKEYRMDKGWGQQ